MRDGGSAGEAEELARLGRAGDLAADLAGACPANEKGENSKMNRETKAESKPPTPEPQPAPAPVPEPVSKTEAEQDKELMGSFAAELDSVLDEDEDD